MIIHPPYHETINKLLYAILQHFEGNPVPVNVPLPPYYNVTNSLLYEILQKLNAPPPVIYLQFRVLYVSARYGDNATAEPNNISKPYKTITAAKNSAFFSDIIHVLEGNYDEGNLFGFCNYWFDFGTQVIYTGASGAIFQQAPGQCTVRGYCKFRCTGDANVVNVGNWLNCVLDIECESMESVKKTVRVFQNRPFGDPTFFKPHRIRCKRIYSSTESALDLNYNVHADIATEEIVSDSTTQPALFGGNIKKSIVANTRIISNNFSAVTLNAFLGPVTFERCDIICNYDSPLGHGFEVTYWPPDLVEIFSSRITCKNVNAKSLIASNHGNIKLDRNVIANRDTGGVPFNYVNKGVKILLENNEATIDITGLTSLDLINFQNTDILRLSSANPSETITEILNAPKHHSFRLAPQAGLSLNLTSTDPITAGANSIVLESSSIVLDGSKGDWIELHNELHGIGSRQISASIY